MSGFGSQPAIMINAGSDSGRRMSKAAGKDSDPRFKRAGIEDASQQCKDNSGCHGTV
jgi:hypothetical protein